MPYETAPGMPPKPTGDEDEETNKAMWSTWFEFVFRVGGGMLAARAAWQVSSGMLAL